ncbi:MAG TPA: thermonuclease family protein [Nostocaceae cyanobacterium]|nr:thermonuclease family protein [Nostocaceae cyanobacterium]
MQRIIKFLVVLVILFSTQIYPVNAEVVRGRIVAAIDGDTLIAFINNNQVSIRLNCIDAPELAQFFGVESKTKLAKLNGVNAEFDVKGVDKYNRLIAEVFVGKDRHNVNSVMVRDGMAFVYREYLRECPAIAPQLIKYEQLAKQKRLGLWKQKNPVMPWDYRHGESNDSVGFKS